MLDPACGTGNFLYVAMELTAGARSARHRDHPDAWRRSRSRRSVPHQFYGLEINPRAAKIAELVLWIGWLRYRLHDDPEACREPVLAASANYQLRAARRL